MKKKNVPLKILFQYEAPAEDALARYIGKHVKLPDGLVVEIRTIVGSKFRPQCFEINGEHNIGVLRFYCQMNGDKSVSEQEFVDFENMEFEVIENEKQKSILELPYVSKK